MVVGARPVGGGVAGVGSAGAGARFQAAPSPSSRSGRPARAGGPRQTNPHNQHGLLCPPEPLPPNHPPTHSTTQPPQHPTPPAAAPHAHQRARAGNRGLVVDVDGKPKVRQLEDALVIKQDVLGLWAVWGWGGLAVWRFRRVRGFRCGGLRGRIVSPSCIPATWRRQRFVGAGRSEIATTMVFKWTDPPLLQHGGAFPGRCRRPYSTQSRTLMSLVVGAGFVGARSGG
jgi:hypothetical protein